MEKIYEERPFKTRNADEFDLSQILNLFVSPLEGSNNPFEYGNSIVKGRMGTGKTMYLRSNYAYYLYNLVPRIMNEDELFLPVFIKLSDFQHIGKPEEIYRQIIIKIIKELTEVYIYLTNANKMACIHMGMKMLAQNPIYEEKLSSAVMQLLKLNADEYVETLNTSFGFKGGLRPQFLEVSGELHKSESLALKNKPNPGIADIERVYNKLVSNTGGKILLLVDEAGVLDKNFFKGKDNDSFFEILMNQLRTAVYVRTKIAIYPQSYSDILTETRYGDMILLEENILDSNGYKRFQSRTKEIMKNYLSNAVGEEIMPHEVFDIVPDGFYGDCLEQIINASGGNFRRLIQLLDTSMTVAYREHHGTEKVMLKHVQIALREHSGAIENLFNEQEIEFLEKVARVCKSRNKFKFRFPYMSPILYKYTAKSKEYNILNIVEAGSGRKGTTYAVDYAYCVAHDIPTHTYIPSGKIDKKRSLKTGKWISGVAQISAEIMEHADIPGKIEGKIDWVKDDNAFVTGDDGNSYFTQRSMVIKSDQHKTLIVGKRVRFYPAKIHDTYLAHLVEILQ